MECIIVQSSNKAKAFLKEMLAADPPLIPPAAIIPSTSAIHAYIRHSLKGLSVRHATVNSNYKCFYYSIKCSPSSKACMMRLCRPYTTDCLKNGRKLTGSLLSNADSMYTVSIAHKTEPCYGNYSVGTM